MTRQLPLFISILALTAVLMARAESPVATPLPVSPASLAIVNTSAPAANASVVTVMPPESFSSISVLTNITFASVGLNIAAAVSQFNASIPVQAANSTIAPLRTVNASVASLLPSNATQVISENDSSTLLVADPSWGKAIVVNASSLNSTKLVVSNATDLGATTIFTTVYNTTTVVQNADTETHPWQHSVCTATFQEQSVWQPVANGTFNASVRLVVRSTTLDNTTVPWTLSLTNAGGYSGAVSTYGLVNTTATNGTVTGEVVEADQTLLPQAGNAPNFDLIIASSFANFDPVNVSVNGDSCAIIIDSNVTMEPLPNVTVSSSGGAETESAAGLTTSNGQITDFDGNMIVFKGVNWFGFDDGNTGPDGLWAGSNSITQDFANIVLRIKALGFNAVRLPFSFKNLKSAMRPFGRSCSFVSGNTLASSTVPGGTNVAAGASFPSLSEPPQSTQTLGVCSGYLDVGTTFNRLVYVVRLLTHNGFYVLLDNQFNLDTSVLDNQNQWLSDWTTLLRAIAQDPISSQKLMIDVLNEPDVFGVRWEAANGKPGYADLCIRLMDAAYSIVPGALLFVEGTAQSGLAYNWGDGLASTPAALHQYGGISDAGLFFEQVMSKPYLNQVVASPHVYPPSITKAHDKYTGSALFNRLSLSFGYLNKQGYCSRSNPGNCHRFPVVIGETGTNFALQADQQQMADFALYLNNQGAGNDGQHNAIPSWFWWAWNANSGQSETFIITLEHDYSL
uniref:Putative extracellular protein TR9_013c n=1 Tax=Trebouxia lynnae TaxID=1825957 RepID=A0A7L9QEE6_9CHLO|nr:putative extracellular protein TR9_013c [Trebouxia lynnae]